MPQYATPAELATWLDPDAESPAAPPLATVLIREASRLVLDAIAGAVYRVDLDGLPVDPRLRTAVQEATLIQASAWSAHGLDPRKGASQVPRRVQSKGAMGATVSYVSDPAADTALAELASGDYLVSAAWDTLRNAGLISTAAYTGYGYGGREYHLTPTSPFVLGEGTLGT